jgi:hypothetical protein
MFLVGCFTSSLTVAMRSYPSKAMKVRPMATRTPLNPLGNMGVNSAKAVGRWNKASRPKAMNTPKITILAIVTTFSALPVTSAPRTFKVMKKEQIRNVIRATAP